MNTAMPNASNERPIPGLLACAFVAFAIVFLAFGLVHLIDGDEGYILLAAKLVASGRMPYRDFFFPQGPLAPLAYAPIPTWYAARALSAVAAAATGTLLVANLRSRVSTSVVAVAALAYATNALALAWFPVAKTYALPMAFLYAAHVLASRAGRGWLTAVLTGILCAAAVAGRTYLVVAVPFVMSSLFSAGAPQRRRLLVGTLAMVVAGGLLAIPLLTAPASALYSTIGYHLVRMDFARPSVATIVEAFEQKRWVVKQLLLIEPGERAPALQLLLIVGAVVAGARSADRRPALRLAAALFVVSMLLSPTQIQYVCFVVPFLIEAAALGMRPIRTGRLRAVAAAAATAYAVTTLMEAHRFALSGDNVPGITEKPENWRIGSVVDASKRLSAVAGDSLVLASWPGYLVESSARPWPGAENNFGFLAGDGIADPKMRRAVHLLSTADAIALVRDRKVPVLVLGNWSDSLKVGLCDRGANRVDGYRAAANDGDVAIFTLAERTPP
jgi:hypothetical protein